MAKAQITAVLEGKVIGVEAMSDRVRGRRAGMKRRPRVSHDRVSPDGLTLIDGRQRGDCLGVKYNNLLEADQLVKSGFAVGAIARIGAASGWSLAQIKKFARISEGTFSRRTRSGRLSREESERLLRLSHIFERATALHAGDRMSARQWLETPIPALGNQRPVDLAQTEPGAREVDDLIGRISHGIVS
ncbi:MAG: antitoxin Xre/MbcA/ParS toxin-binding domain-containing protein [Tepidisphaeraceae bacterium]|jgi:putative toxin-antitoxin system antitoxin component (TIGR02293 family)